MKVSDIKAELTHLGATTTGLLEKSDYVEALLEARKRSPRDAPAPVEIPVEDDGDVATGETKKMNNEPAGGGGMPGGMGGGMPGGMGGGGMPGGMGLEDLLKSMGGMGGGGMPGGMGGGMPGGTGGGMPGGMGGMGGMGDMLGKMMSNPRAMALMQKAQKNPKIMAALQDVQANGPGAMSKYSNDPEIMSVVKELQEIMG